MSVRWLRYAGLVCLPVLALGCQNLRPAYDLPPTIPLVQDQVQEQNPAWVPLPPKDYGRVFETALQTLSDYGFEIADSNRYSGHIEAVPRVAPGLALLFKPGSPDIYERLLSTTQTYRNRVTVVVQTADPQPADHGGYFVEFIVRKELEDLPRPIRSTVGGAVFRNENTVERATEVIDATFFEPAWIYRGRDKALEHEMIRRFKLALCE
ncbi:MAG: hypothetical protein HYX68_14625 [Planctomycetes bacterium]|nr:hypothetical protein [Planctomycetota bacterium]